MKEILPEHKKIYSKEYPKWMSWLPKLEIASNAKYQDMHLLAA